MLTKIKLFNKINRFYSIFHTEVGDNFIHSLFDMTNDNLYDVLFDINEAIKAQEWGFYQDTNKHTAWLKSLYHDIEEYRKTRTPWLVKLLATLSIAFIVWGIASTIEVACKNLEPNPTYSRYNFWALFFNEDEPNEASAYTTYGRYYIDGTVITDDGNEWSYSTDTISNQTPTDNMPVWVGFSDNGTPNNITDDIILGLVYDLETAIYDDLETAFSDKFEFTREGNNIHIGGIK